MKDINTIGKPYFKEYISLEYTTIEKIFMILGNIFAIAIFFVLAYGFYLDNNNYLILGFTIFFLLNFSIAFDTFNKLVYKTELSIGDKGFTIVKINRKNNKQKDIKVVYFKDISSVNLEDKYHYRVAGYKGYVEHLIVKTDNNIMLDIDYKNINFYDKIKDILIEQYQIYKVMR